VTHASARRWLGAPWRLIHTLFSPHRRALLRFYRSGADERWLFPAGLTGDAVVIEVGGHVGEWVAKLRARSPCNVHVFEPVPEFHRRLVERFKEDPRIHLHAVGLGARDRVATLGVAGDASSLYQAGDAIEIRLVDGAAFLASLGVARIDLMNVNCEGGEYELLPRLIEAGWLARVTRLQIQFHRLGPDYRSAADAIRAAIDRTHERTFHFPFVWEGWRLRAPQP